MFSRSRARLRKPSQSSFTPNSRPVEKAAIEKPPTKDPLAYDLYVRAVALIDPALDDPDLCQDDCLRHRIPGRSHCTRSLHSCLPIASWPRPMIISICTDGRSRRAVGPGGFRSEVRSSAWDQIRVTRTFLSRCTFTGDTPITTVPAPNWRLPATHCLTIPASPR